MTITDPLGMTPWIRSPRPCHRPTDRPLRRLRRLRRTTPASMNHETLVERLHAQQARFRVIEHPAEGRSDLVAQLRGTAPGQGAKAMLCKSKDGRGSLALLVLPGDRKLDFKKVASALGLKQVTLASPEEAMAATGNVIGAIPPFADEGIALWADPALIHAHDEIAFNAGRLDRSIVLDSQDYLRIAQPRLAALCS
jgi:Ala-tRNA(Pro) deacylase